MHYSQNDHNKISTVIPKTHARQQLSLNKYLNKDLKIPCCTMHLMASLCSKTTKFDSIRQTLEARPGVTTLRLSKTSEVDDKLEIESTPDRKA